MARSIPVRVPPPTTVVEHRQHCHDIIRDHVPIRTWRSLWRRRCVECGGPWIKHGHFRCSGCRPVRDAVTELGTLLEDRRLSNSWRWSK